MSLPSQSSRSARSSAVHYRRSQNSPIRKLIPAILVIGALALILWFALIRPSSSADQPTDQIAQNEPAQQTNSPINEPIQISNASQPPPQSPQSRPLPGSGNRPDTQKEVESTLATTNNSNTPSNTRSDPSSLLNATRNQPTQTTNPTFTQPSLTQPSQTSRPIADRITLQLDTARRMIAQNDRVAARRLLSQTLRTPNLSQRDAQQLRDELTAINAVLIFGPVVAPNDPITEEYKIKSGDSLSRIASRQELATHWKLIQRINKISNPARIRLGQTLKLVRGPFHAIVYKSQHRMDIYHGSPNDPDNWLFIRSFNVGLGTDNGTPIGDFTISTNKLENPGWVNPRNAAERYTPDDPKNPIGEYWLGLDGTGQYTNLTGYGLHGTIDPDSIGDNQSMGCVRLADEDIAIVYELLVERISVVQIRP